MKEHILKIRLMFFFTVLALVLFATVGTLFFKSTKGIINTSKEKEIKTLSEETADKIDRFLFERYGDISVMSNSPILKEPNINNKMKFDLIESVRNAYKTYDYIFITDKFANVTISSGETHGDMHYEDWIKSVLKGEIYVSDITYLNKEKAYVIYYAAPIIEKNGAITGAVVERMNFSSLLAIIKKVEPGKTGFAFLMQQDSKFSIFDPSFKSRERIIKIEDISGGINYYNSGASKLIYAYCPIKAYNTQKNKWFLVVQEPVNEAFEVSMALRNYVIILLMISTIIIIVFAFISADKITKPFSIMNRDLKNMNKKVNEMSEELKKSAIRAKNLESLAAMSAGLAHEIRNPLTSIKGYAQFIKSEIGSSSELKEDITVIIDEVDRLNKITERFLSFARPEKPDLSSNDINGIIIESVKAIKKEIDKNDINISMELNGVPKTMLDREQMEQVIINIIINSIQAMGKNGNIGISTSFIKEFNMVQVSISDTGGGIKKEDQDKVFEPFYTTKDKGTGLGLAICSRIIENHDGYIDFKSREGEGTVFLIKLPAIED